MKSIEIFGFKIFEWNNIENVGIVLDSNSAFFLPDESMRDPDVAWIGNDRWEALSDKQKKSIPHIVPDFVIELQSDTDNFDELLKKIQVWANNGVKLVWLVSPQKKATWVIENAETAKIPFSQDITGGAVLSGLSFNMGDLLGIK